MRHGFAFPGAPPSGPGLVAHPPYRAAAPPRKLDFLSSYFSPSSPTPLPLCLSDAGQSLGTVSWILWAFSFLSSEATQPCHVAACLQGGCSPVTSRGWLSLSSPSPSWKLPRFTASPAGDFSFKLLTKLSLNFSQVCF